MSWDQDHPDEPPATGGPWSPPEGRTDRDPAAEAPTVEERPTVREAPTAEQAPARLPEHAPPSTPPPAPSGWEPSGPSAWPANPPAAPSWPAAPAARAAHQPWGAGARPTDVTLPPVPPAGGPHEGPPPVPPLPPHLSGGAPTPPPPLPPVHTPPRKPRTGLKMVGAAGLGALLVLSGFGARMLVEDDDPQTVVRPTTVSTVDVPPIDPDEEPLAAVAAAVSDSVVQVELSGGLGSGVVYDDQGHVLTNAHVVGNASTVTVRDSQGDGYEGRVVGTDPETDIAVIDVEGLDAPAMALDTDELAVGQTAIAVGSPFGLEQTVTAGIVSALDRPVAGNDRGIVVNMIQTDAAINPGNSGGALLNRSGELIGINTAIFSQDGDNSGIGFAIPIEVASRVADQIISGEETAKAGLGLSGPSTTPSGDAGAYVQSLVEGGAAERAGIEVGDLIVAVDGDAVRSFEQLRGIISSYTPGTTVTVTVERDGDTVDVEVTLGTLGTR